PLLRRAPVAQALMTERRGGRSEVDRVLSSELCPMESLFRYVARPSQCGYLPEQTWSLEYDYVTTVSDVDYLALMKAGWRHFGHMLFRPQCPACTKCRSLRVKAAEFRPDRSQRRVRR